jgi:hypothetical protein
MARRDSRSTTYREFRRQQEALDYAAAVPREEVGRGLPGLGPTQPDRVAQRPISLGLVFDLLSLPPACHF